MLAFLTLVSRLSGLLLAAMWLIGKLMKPDPIGKVVGRVAWVMPTLVFVALLMPNIWFTFALLLVLLPVVARDKADAAALYVVALVALPTLSVFLQAGSTGLLAIDNYKILSLGLLIAALIKPGPRGRISWMGAVPVLLMVVLDSIALGRGQNATSMLREVSQSLLHWLLPFVAISLAVSRMEDVRRVVIAFIASAGALCVVAAYQAKTFWPIYESIVSHYGIELTISQGSKIRGGLMRAGASFEESTSFAWYLAIVLMLTIQSREQFRSRVHFFAVLALIGLGLLLTQARGPWLGAAIGLVLLDVYNRRFARAAIKVLAAGACYIAAIGFADRFGMFSDVLSRTGSAQTTIDYRAQLLTRGLHEIRANPILGYDLATVQAHLADLRQGEGIIDFVNTYVYYGLLTGVPGAALFGLTFLWAGWAASRQPRERGRAVNRTAPVLFALSGMTLVTAATSGFSGNMTTFFAILIALGVARPGRAGIRRAVASQPLVARSASPAPMAVG